MALGGGQVIQVRSRIDTTGPEVPVQAGIKVTCTDRSRLFAVVTVTGNALDIIFYILCCAW